MTTTAGLGLETISESQIQKFQTHNDALDQIDRAFTAILAVDVSAGNATITSLQARSNQVLACTGATVTGRTVTLPAVTRMLILTLDLASTESVSVVRGSTSFAVAPGEAVFVYADGSADGLLVLGTGAISGSSTVILPVATASVLGGIKVGAGLSITAPGVLSLNLDTIGNTQGDILYRDGSAWVVLGAGTAGQVLQSGGAGANPSWATGSYSLPAATASIRGGVTVPAGGGLALSGDALALHLDDLGATQGDVLYRGASGWAALAPGGAGQVLQSGGAGANPSWATPSAGGATTLDGLSDVAITSPAAGQTLHYDGSGWANAATPYDLSLFIEGTMTNSEIVYRGRPRACSFPSGAAGSYADAGTAATGSLTLSALKNGVAFATFAWSAAGTVAAVTISSTTTFNGTTDILTFAGAATADATLANIGIYLSGTRS